MENSQKLPQKQVTENLPERLHSLTDLLPSLDKEERDVLIKKYEGKRICEMNENEIIVGAELSLFDISVITGWVIPDHEVYKEKLITQLVLKLKESYHDMNFSEISYAMRKYCSEVEDYGKSVNLALIDKVVKKYKAERMVVSEIELSLTKEKQVVYTAEQLDEAERENAQRAYERYLKGQELLSPEMNSGILIRDGYIRHESEVLRFFEFCQLNKIQNIYVHE